MKENDTLDGTHWYLVSYTAHNPFTSDTINAVMEVELTYPWQPGSLDTVAKHVNHEMIQAGYDNYTKPIVTGVFYMGEF